MPVRCNGITTNFGIKNYRNPDIITKSIDIKTLTNESLEKRQIDYIYQLGELTKKLVSSICTNVCMDSQIPLLQISLLRIYCFL